jgi:SET domain-containing protein
MPKTRTRPAASPVEVRHSPIHGHGVFALRAIRRGRRIGHYAGRRYNAEEAAARDWDNVVTYVFGLSDGSLIDGGDGGNAMRHLNHSCAPNCQAYEVTGADGVLGIEIEAARSIAAGEELFLDYSLVVDSEDGYGYTCRCGAAACRGTMAAPASAQA